MTSFLTQIDTHLRLRDTHAARTVALEALATSPDFFVYFERLGQIAKQEGREQSARNYLEFSRISKQVKLEAHAEQDEAAHTKARGEAIEIVLKNEAPGHPDSQPVISFVEALGGSSDRLLEWVGDSETTPTDLQSDTAVADARASLLLKQIEELQNKL